LNPVPSAFLRLPMCIGCGIFLLFTLSSTATAQEAPAADTASRLETLQLNGDFTLRYKMVKRYNSSAKTLKRMLDSNIFSVKQEVKEGRLSADEGEEGIKIIKKALEHGLPVGTGTITITGHDGKLRRDWDPGGDPAIYDGHNTYSYNVPNNRLTVNHEFTFYSFQEMPLPGVGLPGLPLVKLATRGASETEYRGDVFNNTANAPTSGGPMYLPGTLETSADSGKRIRVLGMLSLSNKVPYQKWEFLAHTAFGSLLIASHIRVSQYDHSDIRGIQAGKVDVASVTDFTLLSASDKPVSDALFAPEQFLTARKGDPRDYRNMGSDVQWNETPEPVAYEYMPGKSLEEQRDAAAKVQKETKDFAAAEQRGQRSRTGPILIGTLLVVAAWWILRRRRLPKAS